jgi:murein DD-endopeptidase MepM/ murein hydrolase activator NlpD
MKLSTVTEAGNAPRLINNLNVSPLLCAASFLLAALLPPSVLTESLYKYQDEQGRWVFTDRQPESGQDYQLENRAASLSSEPQVLLHRGGSGSQVKLFAENTCYCPAEVFLQVTALSNTDSAAGEQVIVVIPAKETTELTTFRQINKAGNWSFDYEHAFLFGDPTAAHQQSFVYRPPFAAAKQYRISQAYPDSMTHNTADSRHAVDIVMPENTNIFAARGGTVVAVAHSNFRGGADRAKYGAMANIVKILHDDGSFAVYAHLSWDSIRVRPGEFVNQGQYIADSGNTGFSTGPHLHFVVIRNDGTKSISVPLLFNDGQGGTVNPRTGANLQNP